MLDELFKTILNLTITGSLVALVILVLRFSLAKFISKRIFYVLWFVLIFRLLFPFSLESAFSLFNAVPTASGAEIYYTNEYIKLDAQRPNYPKLNINLPPSVSVGSVGSVGGAIDTGTENGSGDNDGNNESAAANPEEVRSVDPIQIGYFITSILWLIGAASLLLYYLVAYLKIRGRLKTAYHYPDTELVQACRAKIRLRSQVPVLLSEHLQTPIVCGLFRPAVILPVFCEKLEKKQLEKIIVHELYHIKRFDTTWNLLFLLAVGIHFFNPLVWLSYSLFKKDMELSCDEKVLEVFGQEAKADYANTLLDFSAEHNSIPRSSFLAFGESGIKFRIKEIMRYRKKGTLLTALAIIIVLVTACATLTNGKSENPFEPNPSALNQDELIVIDENSPTLYGAIQTPFENFRLTEEVPKKVYPVPFSENGKMGFKDKDGNVIVEPLYNRVQQFWNGVGGIRIDNPDRSFTWKTLDLQGNVYDYDEVYGFAYGLSDVKKGDKYGYINGDGELVVPLQYDELFNAYIYPDEESYQGYRSSYALKDGKFVYLNLKDGYEEVFEKYDPAKQSEYKRYVNMKDYSLAVVNDMLVVNGRSDPNGTLFPLMILEGKDFKLFKENESVGTFQAKVTRGNYEGEVFIYFPGYSGVSESGTFSNADNPGEYYAVPVELGTGYRELSEAAGPERYMDTVKLYLRDKNAENAPVRIDRAVQGDFDGDGQQGVLLQINDTYRQRGGGDPLPFTEQWTTRKFADDKTAFVNSILIIDNISKPLEYRVIKSNVWTHTDWDYKIENIAYVANFDADDELELMIENGYYEYGDYALVDLGKDNSYYPKNTVGVVEGTIIRNNYEIASELRERELQSAMVAKMLELFSEGQKKRPGEIMAFFLEIEEKDFDAEQKRYIAYVEMKQRVLTPNEAFNVIMREEALYQEAVKRGYLMTEDEAREILQQSDVVTAQQMEEDPESEEKYAELLRYENELLGEIGFESRETYWYWYHAPMTAKASTITRLQDKFKNKIQVMYPNLEGYDLWVKQENLWQDYAEYLLKKKNAKAVTDKYTLEFTGEEWKYGESFKN